MNKLASLALVATVANTALATVYYHTGSDPSSSAKAFEDDSRWTDRSDPSSGVAPLSPNASEEDEYVLDSGFFRGNVSSYPVNLKCKTFTIKQLHITWKATGTENQRDTRYTYFKKLVLEGALKNNAQLGHLELGSSNIGWIRGNVEVLTKRATPFYFQGGASSSWAGFGLDAALCGDATTGLKFQPGSMNDPYNMRMIINADNSLYYGNFQVDGGNGSVWLQFKDAKSFGAVPDEVDEESLVLGSGAILEVTTPGETLPCNRGIYVNGVDAVSNVQFRADVDWTVQSKLTGTGDLEKTGSGRLTFDTDWPSTMGKLVVKDGSVVFAPGRTAPSMVEAETYAVAASCNDTTPANILDLGDAAFGLRAPIVITMTDQPTTIAQDLTVPVLKFKSSYVLRPCDFVITGLTPAALRNEVAPLIETDADGYQIVSVKLLNYTILSSGWKAAMDNKFCPASDVEGVWMDGKIPSGCVGNYCVGTSLTGVFANDFRVSTYNGTASDWTFGGATLSLNGSSLSLKEKVARIADLRIESNSSNSGVKCVGCSGTATEGRVQQDVAGKISIFNSTRTTAIAFTGRDDVHFGVQSDLVGNGWIRFLGENVKNPGGSYIYLSGDNANYIGGFTVAATVSDAGATIKPARLILNAQTKASSLGGRPFGFLADALTVDQHGALEVRNDYVYDIENRGLTYAASADLVVSNDVTFTVGQRFTIADGQTVTLRGKGTLAVKKVAGTSGAKIAIGEGGFQPLATDALTGAAIELGTAASLVVDADTDDASLRQKGLTDPAGLLTLAADADKLNVKIRVSETTKATFPTIAILTVPDAQAATWRGRLTAANVKVLAKGVAAEIVESSDGTYTTFAAHLVSKGLILIFR